MPEPDHLFVYGTLRNNGDHPAAARLRESSTLLGPATFQGQLYHLGDYPGAVDSDAEADRVTGEVYALPEEDAVLAALDHYEGCDPLSPRRSLFRRERHPVRLESGETVQAWVYLYNQELENRPRIPSGDWLAETTDS